MDFRIISRYQGSKMYPGQVIEYTVKPLLNIPMYWMTEITHVQPKEFFVDEQRFGPYSMWHHQKQLTEIFDYRFKKVEELFGKILPQSQ